LTALGQQAFGSVGQEAEVTDTHKALGNYVEQEAADEFVGIEGHSLFSVVIFSVPVTKSDFSAMG